ncbi:MAG: Ig-like domain-containing protein [Chloroflexota bacterium]
MRAKMKATISPVASLLALVALLVCPACAPERAPPAAEPSVTITSPPQGDTLEPGDITISINAQDFNIVEKLGEEPVPGEGHVHYYKDVEPPTTAGQPAVTKEGTYAVTTSESHTWEDVGPGEHSLLSS